MIMTKNVYAFIDAQNLYLGIRSLGWKVDYRKLRLYLKNKYGVTRALMFIGYVPAYEQMYQKFCNAGFELVFKQIQVRVDQGTEIIKGNVDAELVLHAAAIEFDNYEEAILVTNDGDFLCLVEFLEERGKFKRLLAPNRKFSKLYRYHKPKIDILEHKQKALHD
jgi:uncharacterized LabA/DUF88 family protein